MSSIELTGNWGSLQIEAEAALARATDEVGNTIVGLFKQHFAAQDLGWAPLKASTKKRKAKAGMKNLSRASTRELRGRAGKLGIPGAETLGRSGLMSGLSAKSATLIDTGLLASSFTYKKLSAYSGQVGVIRKAQHGANLAAIHEYGNPAGGLPARPFVKPVATEMEGKLQAIYDKYLDGVKIT